MADFAGAWVFYSVLPGLPWVEPSFQRIARFAPWIGLTLGVIQGGFWWLLTFLGWPSIAVAPLLLAFGIWFSGGLHHDGLMDTADGLAAGRSRRLEAMEDSRVGASGVLALAMVLLIEMGALIQLGPQAPVALLLAAIGARAAPLWAMAHFDYLRQDGSAAFHREHARPGWDLLPLLPLLALLLPLAGALSLVIGTLVALLVPEWLGRRLGGHTGDSYGATVVLTEAFILLVSALLATAI